MPAQTNSEGTSRSPSAAAQEQPSPKRRRRVAKACQNCRSQKAKCDGKPPICSRCAGYGHTCTWSEEKKDRLRGLDGSSSSSRNILPDGHQSPFSENSTPLRLAIQSYEKLVRSVRLDLTDSTRAAVDLGLSYIRCRLPPDVLGPDASSSVRAPPVTVEACHQSGSAGQSANRQRYFGEASDLHYFHTIKNILQDQDQPGSGAENDIQSYDHGIQHIETQGSVSHTDLPTKELADTHIEIYFSTIHIAYPFVSKPSFIEKYERFWNGDTEVTKNSSWLSLMYTIFAIGAYYTSFPLSENAERQAHIRYFEQAMSISTSIMTDCTLENIQMLLVHCFFLLATGQTDRCWSTLGLAVRGAQSIGLHVEHSLRQPLIGLSTLEQETMRRTWYSMYVLDRLLALQLGRPVAIHEQEYRVNLPSETEETACLFDGDSFPFSINKSPSTIDYFVSVTKFSQILGQVISDLYSPSQAILDPDRMLLITTTLDKQLLEWKLKLPRHLRFDLGHTFEKSIVFKRQRNMLAIKFHHLRTLMHRPYLCLAWLQRQNRPLMDLLERAHDRVEALERICMLEAQQTAHLLHNVSDERSLVHDFPWWQMISCLLCASSVLLVSRACIDPTKACAEAYSQSLDEDAETCLKVFDALSANSDAARRARDMMKGLKKTRILPRNALASKPDSTSINEGLVENGSEMPSIENVANTLDGAFSSSYGVTPNVLEWQIWPGELSDPMAWSAQFINPLQSSQFDGNPVPGPQIPLFAHIEENN